MNNNVFEQPQQEPHNVFTHENNTHSFARRTISWFITIGAIILLIGVATGWGFGMNLMKDTNTAQHSEISASAVPGASMPTQTQTADTDRSEKSWAESFKDFIKNLINDFRGPSNGEQQGALNSTAGVVGGSAGVNGAAAQGEDGGLNIVGSADPLTEVTEVTENAEGKAGVMNGTEKEAVAASQALQQNEIAEIVENPEQTLPPQYFEGKIVDYEGKPAGDIKAIIRNNEGKKSFFFTLDQSLTPADKSREFQISYDDVEIIEENGSAYVKLSKAQTEAIAKTLFEEKQSAE
jgi:hypothetical protein